MSDESVDPNAGTPPPPVAGAGAPPPAVENGGGALPVIATGLVTLMIGAGLGWFLHPVFFGDDDAAESVADATVGDAAEGFVAEETVAPQDTVPPTTAPETTAPEVTAAPETTVAPEPATRYADPTRSFTVAMPDDLVAQSGRLLIPTSGLVQATAQPDTSVENYTFTDRFLQVTHFPDPASTIDTEVATALTPDGFAGAVCAPGTAEPFSAGAWSGTTVRFSGCPGLDGFLQTYFAAPDGTFLRAIGSIGSPADEEAFRAMIESITFGDDPAVPVPDERRCFALPPSTDPAFPLSIRFVNHTGLEIPGFFVFEGVETPLYEPNVIQPGIWDDRTATAGTILRFRVGEQVLEVPYGPEPTKCFVIDPL